MENIEFVQTVLDALSEGHGPNFFVVEATKLHYKDANEFTYFGKLDLAGTPAFCQLGAFEYSVIDEDNNKYFDDNESKTNYFEVMASIFGEPYKQAFLKRFLSTNKEK